MPTLEGFGGGTGSPIIEGFGGAYTEGVAFTPINPLPGDTNVSINTTIYFSCNTNIVTKDVLIYINTYEIDSSLFDITSAPTLGPGVLLYSSKEALSLRFGSIYQIRVEDEAGDNYREWFFSTENGYLYIDNKDQNEYYYPVTQFMANGFPYESKLRNERYSNGQIFLNQFSPILDRLDENTAKAVRNQIPSLCDTTEINRYAWANLYQFEFKSRVLPNGNRQFILPTVYGRYNNYHKILVTPVTDNNIANLETALPLYVWSNKKSVFNSAVTSFRPGVELDDEIETYSARPLFVKISDGSDFVSRLGDSTYYMSFLEIKGMSERWIKEIETIPVFYNGIYLSTKKWRHIETINLRNTLNMDTENVDIKYSFFPLALETVDELIPETNFTLPTVDGMRKNWWSYSHRTNRTDILKQSVTLATNVDEFADFTTEIHTYNTYEMYDYAGGALDISAIWPDLNDRYLYVLGMPRGEYNENKYLYLFDKHDDFMPKTLITELKTDTGDPVIDLDLIVSDTTLDENGELPVEVAVYANSVYAKVLRIKVKIRYLDSDNTVVTQYFDTSDGSFHSSFGWYENEKELFTRMSFNTTLTTNGFYIFTAEYINTRGEEGSVSRVLHIKEKTPVGVYKLGGVDSKDLPVDLFVDNDNVINLVTQSTEDDTISIYQIELFYNYFALDFTGKKIMGNYEFDEFEVEYADSGD